MAQQPEYLRRLENLEVDDNRRKMTSNYFNQDPSGLQNTNVSQKNTTARSSAASLETNRATPPMNIPKPSENAIAHSTPSSDEETLFIDHYLRNRNPSISFDNEVRTDIGHRQSINNPLPKRGKDARRGRSILHELADEQEKLRSHSESTRDHFDPFTGRHLPQFSTSPPKEKPHVGEARFPLLQTTVDKMALESNLKLDMQPMSMTSRSTLSPTSEAPYTPHDDESRYPLSPMPISPPPRNISTSLESSAPRPFRRTASQRWRDGEASQDFFSAASNGSLRKSNREGSSLKSSSRRGTNSSGKAGSVASSFLRGFSINSGDGESYKPPAVDAEGQTIGEDYVLGKQIGFGGFSVIKEVTQLSSETGKQRKLAVKIVRRSIEGKTEVENDAAQAEFDHEVELWRFLNHPNILPLEAVYKLDEATFCFIPLNVGGTLFDLVRNNRQGLAHDLAQSYAYQLASAIRYLHLDARVVHRDIKLENCLIETSNGEPGLLRLCDFGMADWIDGDQENNTPNSMSTCSIERPASRAIGPADSSTSAFAGGSLEYAPPEVVRVASSTSLPVQALNSTSGIMSPGASQKRNVCASTDIWAFGVCLYSMVVGKRPFSNSFVPRVVMAILAGDYDHEALAEKANEDVDLIDLVEGCLITNEKRRWDIRAVMECQWFEDQRMQEMEAENARSGGWRL